MASMEDKMKTEGPSTLLEEMNILKELQNQTGVKKPIHTGLWHTCAGPLVSLPQLGSLVYYFPQGHIEQVAISTKGSATSQIPNYSNLQPQLVCQVHTVTMHADKDTDEIFAQMSLQPIKSDKDVLPIPDFSPNYSKHPTEFFCKTLTASDTSTHGGFSVPRRAAEKLFPPLDYSMQPPSQELVVRDLHDNTWTFRHIYRGQPKRHLLTTGWSIFVSSKRLRSGDSVLFIRDEKSQLMVGVRRAKRQQTTLPSSVLSTDSMHIGVLAAAAHADANRSPFTIFYNPRACPSDFVIPINKYHKAVHGTQISLGMRFGMMFETEDSGKRRYMGTIVGTSELDPLRWPGSKWRSLQVEWDEPGCSDKPNRVSPWEIETPESLFLFPSLTSGFKRHFLPGHMGGEFEWGNSMKKPLIPTIQNGYGSLPYPSIPNLYSDQLMKMLLRPQPITIQSKPQLMSSSINNNAFVNTDQTQPSNSTGQDKTEAVDPVESQVVEVANHQHNIVNENETPPSIDVANFPQTDVPEWIPEWIPSNFEPSMNGLVVNMSDSCLDFDGATDVLLGDMGTFKDADFHYPTDCLLGNFGSNQDLQSQITSASLADSQAFAIQDFPDNSVVTSSSNIDFDESSLLQNRSWQQVNPPMRTFTKVQKAGSVGRSIDVNSFRNYGDLRSGIERMFGLDGMLNDPRGSGWRLVYVDFENDVLLVGDDPWEEFVSCVRCIRILSPAEVQQMSKEGVQLLNANTTQEINSSQI